MFAVTNRAEEVYDAIAGTTHHGATIIEGQGAYEDRERKIVYSVVSSAESKKVIRAIKEADPHAFVNLMKTEQVAGKFYQKPNE